MKIIKQVSKKEMKKKFPNLMSALGSADAQYCNKCDGLRVHKKLKNKLFKCLICNTTRTDGRMI